MFHYFKTKQILCEVCLIVSAPDYYCSLAELPWLLITSRRKCWDCLERPHQQSSPGKNSIHYILHTLNMLHHQRYVCFHSYTVDTQLQYHLCRWYWAINSKTNQKSCYLALKQKERCRALTWGNWLPKSEVLDLGKAWVSSPTLIRWQRSFFQCRNIAKVRPFVNQAVAEKLFTGFISNRMDCCKVLFTGLPKKTKNKPLTDLSSSETAAGLLTRTRQAERTRPV